MQTALGEAEQRPAGQVDKDRGLHQPPRGSGRVIDVTQIQVQHRDRRNREDQADGECVEPRLRRQQPIRDRQPASERHSETRHGDFYALAIQTQVDDVAEDMPKQQGEAQAVEVFQPVRCDQLCAAELPARFDPEIHQ